jgi:tetratricopeptide (TPR) repeat protein
MVEMQDLAALEDLIRRQELAAAREAINSLLAAGSEDPVVLDLNAELCLRERQPQEAFEAVRRALSIGGESSERLDRLGRCLNNLGRLPEAERALKRAIDLSPRSADAHARLGHVLLRLRRLQESGEALTRAIELDPEHHDALKALGMLRLAERQHSAAADLFRRACAVTPDNPRTLGLLGVALHRSGDLEGAERTYRRALAADATDADTWMNLGITLQDRHRLDDALQAYREAARQAPHDAAPRHRLAEGLFLAGEPDQALAVTDEALSIDGGDPTAVAVKIVALQALGRGAEAGELLGLDTLIQEMDIAPPTGYGDIGEFDRQLARHVLEHPTLTFEPEGHATRRGRHTRDLLVGDKGPVAGLEKAILNAVDDYLDRLQTPPGHPFPGRVPQPHRLSMWAVVMDTDGHQLPHIHPAAWLSGVYYVELPETLGLGGDDVAGWIEFGLAPDELRTEDHTPVRLFCPAEGRLYLFPSFLYHRTIPFSGDARRISIAFDVLRRPGG